jgi:hypothetical protein
MSMVFGGRPIGLRGEYAGEGGGEREELDSTRAQRWEGVWGEWRPYHALKEAVREAVKSCVP